MHLSMVVIACEQPSSKTTLSLAARNTFNKPIQLGHSELSKVATL